MEFVVHTDKSVLKPPKTLKYLGFILDSEQMMVTLSSEKALSIQMACWNLKDGQEFSIRELAKVIGKIVAAFPAEKLGPLHYRSLERQKTLELKHHCGDFDALCSPLSQEAKEDLEWWISNVYTS